MTAAPKNKPVKDKALRRERRLPILLLACVGFALFWKIMAEWSGRSFDPFTLTAADLATFDPSSAHWRAEPVAVPSTPIEPNLAAFRLAPQPASDPYPPVFVRLAHGYNMPDCMRIKGYDVELLPDIVRGNGTKPSDSGSNRVQIWRLTDRLGDVSLWATSMLSADDFSVENADVRDLPFPRIGVPDDPRWAPQGLRPSSFRHPIRNLRWYFRARWNNARGDWLTFFRLKRPAWASDESKTLVSTLSGPVVFPGADEAAILEKIMAAHRQVQSALQRWAETLQ